MSVCESSMSVCDHVKCMTRSIGHQLLTIFRHTIPILSGEREMASQDLLGEVHVLPFIREWRVP